MLTNITKQENVTFPLICAIKRVIAVKRLGYKSIFSCAISIKSELLIAVVANTHIDVIQAAK